MGTLGWIIYFAFTYIYVFFKAYQARSLPHTWDLIWLPVFACSVISWFHSYQGEVHSNILSELFAVNILFDGLVGSACAAMSLLALRRWKFIATNLGIYAALIALAAWVGPCTCTRVLCFAMSVSSIFWMGAPVVNAVMSCFIGGKVEPAAFMFGMIFMLTWYWSKGYLIFRN